MFEKFAEAVLDWSQTIGLTVLIVSVIFTAGSLAKAYLNRT